MRMKTGWLYAGAMAAVLALGAMAGLGGGIAQAAPNDPEAVFAAAGERLTAGDLAGSVALYSEDAVVTDIDIDSGKSFYAVGRDAIEVVLQGALATHLVVEGTTSSVDGDEVTAKARWSDDVSAAAGVSRYLVNSSMTVRDNKIVRFATTYDTKDAETVTYLAYGATQPLIPPPGTVTFPMGAGRDGHQAGDAFLAPTTSTVTAVFIAVAAGAIGELEPVQLQDRACPASGSIVAELAPVLNGSSLSLVSKSMNELSDVSVHVQRVGGLSRLDVACGDASDAVPFEEPAPVPAPQPAAPAPRPAPVTAPNTGTGGVRGGSAAGGIGLLAAMGLVCVGAGAARRRVR
jgi:ketosteroid isomerase-like protein